MVAVPQTAPGSDRYTPRYLLVLAAAAAASFIPSLFYYYVGEEGLYTIAAMQMQMSGDFLVPVVPGGNYGRPPLFIWLILLVANVIGWEHVLLASRLVIFTATLLTAAGVGWFTYALFADGKLAACAVLVYLTFLDVLFYRGWLAYSDPLFAFFVFGSIGCAWIAAKRASYGMLAAGLILLSCAFLTKALTAYAFYAVALVLLLLHEQHRRFLLSIPSVVIHLIGAAAPLRRAAGSVEPDVDGPDEETPWDRLRLPGGAQADELLALGPDIYVEQPAGLRDEVVSRLRAAVGAQR